MFQAPSPRTSNWPYTRKLLSDGASGQSRTHYPLKGGIVNPHRPSHHRRQFLKAGAGDDRGAPACTRLDLGRGERAAGERASEVAADPARNRGRSDAQAESRGPGSSHRGRRRGLRDRLRQRRGQAARAGQAEAGIDPERLPDAPPLRPQRGLRQPAPAGLGIRSRDARRRVGSSSARGDDAPVSRDERLRHPHPHRRRRAAAAEGPDRHARDHRGGSRDAGRATSRSRPPWSTTRP